MAQITVNHMGQLNGTGDNLAGMLKVFSGEVLTAFTRTAQVMPNHLVRTIENGKSATFPVFGRATAEYLQPGDNLDDQRTAIQHNEKIIHIDGLLTADALITDIEEALFHADVRGEYAKQLGEALALSADGAIIAEIAKSVVGQRENLTGLGKGIKVEKTVGAGNVGITEAYGKAVIEALLKIRADFSNSYVPMGDRYVYMTPTAMASLIANQTAINRDFGAIGTIVKGDVTELLGFKLIELPHLTQGGAGTKTKMLQGAQAGHEFPQALKNDVAFVVAHKTAVGTLKLKDIALEHARRANFQADQIIAKCAMGHGELRPEACAVCTIKAS